MRYGNLTLYPEMGSTSVTKKKNQIVRHYPGTNTSDSFPLGSEPTIIKTVLLAKTQEGRFLIEQIMAGDTEAELHFDTYYFKRVITGPSSESKPFVDGVCFIPVEFIALDPVPYDEVSGEALY